MHAHTSVSRWAAGWSHSPCDCASALAAIKRRLVTAQCTTRRQILLCFTRWEGYTETAAKQHCQTSTPAARRTPRCSTQPGHAAKPVHSMPPRHAAGHRLAHATWRQLLRKHAHSNIRHVNLPMHKPSQAKPSCYQADCRPGPTAQATDQGWGEARAAGTWARVTSARQNSIPGKHALAVASNSAGWPSCPAHRCCYTSWHVAQRSMQRTAATQ